MRPGPGREPQQPRLPDFLTRRIQQAGKQAGKAAGSLIGREVAHLLNNDLALAAGYVELLKGNEPGETPLSPQRLELVQNIDAGIRDAERHIQGFQNLASLEIKETAVGAALDLGRSITPQPEEQVDLDRPLNPLEQALAKPIIESHSQGVEIGRQSAKNAIDPTLTTLELRIDSLLRGNLPRHVREALEEMNNSITVGNRLLDAVMKADPLNVRDIGPWTPNSERSEPS